VTIIARVIANFNKTVAVKEGESDLIEQAYPLRSVPLLVAGDLVHCIRDDGVLRVQELVARRSVLERADRHWKKPLAANLSHLGIVSANPPGLDTLLIDQFCLAAHQADVEALIIFNKADRMSEEEKRETESVAETYKNIGFPVVIIDTKSEEGLDPLKKELSEHAVTLVGASGVGKSSIIQRLLPERDLVVGAVSEATGLGSHTTSVTFWYELPDGGAIIDSPGVGYHELNQASQSCRFGDCSHTVEPQCGVLGAVDDGQIARWRYKNYLKLADL